MKPTTSNVSAKRAGTVMGTVCALTGLLAIGGPAAARAQSASVALADTSKPVMFLKETVVTGARYPRRYYESPQALSFVSRMQLREQASTVLGDALQLLPGVDNSKDSPWEQRPVLRGLSGQRVLVLMDGAPMNSARGNGPHPSLVDPSQVERIEVVRGPASVAYGSDAIGGVINIITREASPLGSKSSWPGSFTLGGSSADGQTMASMDLSPRIGRFSAFLSSGLRKATNFESPDGEVPNSAFKDYNALFNLKYDFTERLALRGGYQLYRGTDIGIPGLSFASPGASQDFDFAYYDRDLAHLTLDHRYLDSWLESAHVKTYWQKERRNFFSTQVVDATLYNGFGIPPRAGSTRALTDQDRFFELDTYGTQFQMTSRRSAISRWAAGIDVARDVTDGDNVRRRTYAFNGAGGDSLGATAVRVTASVPDGRFDSYAGFMQSEWFVHPKATLHAGTRFTHYRYRTDFGLSAPASGAPGSQPSFFTPTKVDNDALSGSLGVVVEPIQDLHLTANVASGYRQPNAQDLFFSGAASVGFVIGNADLNPEKSLSYDVGLRWGPGPIAISGNVFLSTYDDLIDAISVPPVPASGGQPTYKYVNITNARIWGGEAEAEWRFADQFRARATVAGQIGTITSAEAIRSLYGVNADEAPLGGVPPARGTASVRWTSASGRYFVEPATRWSWRTNRLPLPTPGVAQFTEFKKEWIVADVTAGLRFPTGQRLTAGVRNLADRSYRQALGSLDEPGLSFFGSLSTDF